LRHLIISFKDLMGVMTSQKKPKETFMKPIFYPLNQFHHDYVENAKRGVSDINWRGVIEKITNDVEDDEISDLLEY